MSSRRRGLSQITRVWLYTGCVGAAATSLVLFVLPGLSAPRPDLALPWWVLAIAFAVAECFVVRVHFGRETFSFSVGEIPLALGLAMCGPLGLVLARLAGTALVLPLQRKQSPVKVCFNLCLFVLETAVASAIYHALLRGGDAAGPAGWIATFGAVMATGLLGTLAVHGIMSVHQRTWELQLRAQLVLPAMATFLNASFGVVAVTLIAADARAAWLLFLIVGLTMLAYRSYTALNEKHERLQMLQQFTREVHSSLSAGETSHALLQQVRELLRAEVAELSLLDGDRPLRMRQEAGDEWTIPLPNGPHPLVAHVAATGQPLLVAKSERRPELRAFLDERAVTDVMIVPLKAESTVGTLMVGSRLGDVSTFSDDDLRVLETIARHASVLLENGRLVQQLREEVADKEYQASHDVLTGLANRTLFNERVERAIQRCQTTGEKLAVLLIDLDRFKEVNDTLGHHTGDLLLQQVSQRLSQNVTADVIARLGGDEFAILLGAVAGPAQAVMEAERIRTLLEQPVALPDLELFVGASIGISLYPDHADRAELLLQRSDVAMYAAKQQHSGTEVYAPDRDEHSHRRLALVGELRSAIENGRLEVYYQPKASAQDGRIVGAEALVRWRHTELGYVPPDEFIPVAERTGLIRPLTQHVLSEALSQCRLWRNQGWELGVAVNLSAAVLLNLDFAIDLSMLLDRFDVPAQALTLEITESAIMTDPERAIGVLQTLNGMGVQLSIDDFGTGYSSLSQLKRLPVTELKIDRSFVMNMCSDDNDAVIVRSTIDLGRNLGLAVVAEGVEDAETWRRLRTLGCDIVQGYYLGKPMPSWAMIDWLRTAHADGPVVESELLESFASGRSGQ